MSTQSDLLEGSPQIPLLIAKLKKQRGRTLSAHGRIVWWIVLSFLSLIVSMNRESPLPTVWMLLILLVDAIVLTLSSQREATILKELVVYSDTRAIPILLDSFFHTEYSPSAYQSTLTGLIQALPKVTVDDTPRFQAQHLALLHTMIARYHDHQLNRLTLFHEPRQQKFLQKKVSPETCYALRAGILKAFVPIGNEETARVLKRFIQEDSNSRYKTDLQELARISLLALQKRLDRENDAKTLLRASSENDDSLLRPVYGHHNEERPETLLRAVTPNNENKEG